MALGVFPNGFSEAYFLRQSNYTSYDKTIILLTTRQLYFLRQNNYTSYDKTTIQCMMRHRGMLSTAFDKVAINNF